MAAVRELGLSGYVNTSYPRGLAALLDGAPARRFLELVSLQQKAGGLDALPQTA